MKKKICIFLLLLTAAGMTGCSGSRKAQEQNREQKKGEISEEAPSEEASSEERESLFGSFTAFTQEGEEVSEAIFEEAELTMVNVWGTFCGPCINEMPTLAELSEEYREKGMQIIGIISDVSEPGNETAQEIIDATGADYTHLVLSEALYQNVLWQIQAVPTTIFVDQEGKQVGSAVMGARDRDGWVEIIEDMLREVSDEE